MDRRASRLAAYVEDRLGDGLRAVGHHTDEEFEVEYVREDLVERYPPERVERFIRTSRTLHDGVQSLDDEMGPPEASLHVLEEGLVVQFHFPPDGVIFVSMDRDVGRNFTRFIRDCLDQMD